MNAVPVPVFPVDPLDNEFDIEPVAARALQGRGGLLLDIRGDGERAQGSAEGAMGLPLDLLAAQVEQLEPDHDRLLLVLCAIGKRSRKGVRILRGLGYRKVYSVAGGLQRWQAEGLPTTAAQLDADTRERYLRQLQLPQVGTAGQARLAQAHVAIIGAGGLGSPAALYLAAAGVGQLTLIDDDRVDRSNLQRQILHTDAGVGTYKTDSARASLRALNPHIRVHVHTQRLIASNVEQLLAGCQIILDGSDNFPTRYLLSAASLHLRLPMVYGAVERFSGQLSVFDPRQDGAPCYRCLFPQPPAAEDAPNCSEAGVLGVLPGLIGMLQATETLKLILGLGQPLVGQLLSVDALSMDFRKRHLPRDPNCPGCSSLGQWPPCQDMSNPCTHA